MSKAEDELLAKRRENQNYFSEKLSELSRYMAFGMAAIAFTLLAAESTFTAAIAKAARDTLILVAVGSCLAIFTDYVQLFSGWQSAKLSANNLSGGYEKTGGAKVWDGVQNLAFYTKQVLVFLAAVLLVVAVASQLGKLPA